MERDAVTPARISWATALRRQRQRGGPTAHLRIMAAMEAGRGVRLTADEVLALSRDQAIEECASNEREEVEDGA